MIEFVLSFMFCSNDYISKPVHLQADGASSVVYRAVVHNHYSPSLLSRIFTGQVEQPDSETSILLGKELNIFPKGFLKYARLREIIGCGSFYLYDRNQNGLQQRGGMFRPLSNQIYIDTSCGVDFLLFIFNHELYHCIDYRQGLLINDTEWSSLNESGFQYKRIDKPNYIDNPPSGFVTEYATTGMSDDKAETFAMMIREPERLAHLANNDQTIDRKVKCLKRRLQSICPEINEAFWVLIAKRSTEHRSEERLPPLKFHTPPEETEMSSFMNHLLSVSKLYTSYQQAKARKSVYPWNR